MHDDAALRALWFVAATMVLAGCQSVTQPSGARAMLTGTVTYRERMALPPDATVEVRLEDVSIADAPGIVIAEQTIAVDGRQVPIAFALSYPAERIDVRRRYAVRASIRAFGALLFTTTTRYAVLTDGAPMGDVEVVTQRFGYFGRTFVFDCDGDVSFTVRTGPGGVALWAPPSLGGQSAVLNATPAASGARYADGETVYWNRGELALFEIAGRTFVDCRSNPSKVPWAEAALRGAVFRALGNEPAWNIEIHEDRLVLVTDLGATSTELPLAASASDGARTTYRASGDGHDLTAVVERRICADSMSGELFDAAATVTFDATVYHGCGRFL